MGCRTRIRFVTCAASSYSARSVGGRGQTRGVVVVGEKWAHVVRTPPDRKVVGAGPVGSGHGSYQLVSWWGGQCWCPPMAHAQWWQSGSGAIRDVATTTQTDVRLPKRTPRAMLRSSSRRRGSRSLTATTEYGPWGGTNTGHHHTTLTGMIHAHYQPALHPPSSDLGEYRAPVPTYHPPPPKSPP